MAKPIHPHRRTTKTVDETTDNPINTRPHYRKITTNTDTPKSTQLISKPTEPMNRIARKKEKTITQRPQDKIIIREIARTLGA